MHLKNFLAWVRKEQERIDREMRAFKKEFNDRWVQWGEAAKCRGRMKREREKGGV